MARRAKRPDGRYKSDVRYVDPVSGESRRVSVYGKTQKELTTNIQALRDRVAEGSPVKDSSRLLRDWSKQWRTTSLLASDRRESTKAVTESLLRNHLEPSALGEVRLDRVALVDLERFIIEMRDKKTRSGERRLKESTISRIFQVLKVLLDDAVAHGLIAKNPVDALKRKPKADEEETRYLTNKEVRLLLSALVKSRYYLPLQFIASTGLRKGELIGLRWTDFNRDPENANFTVSRTVMRLNGALRVGPVKTRAGRRTIPLTDETLAILDKQEQAQARDRARAGSLWTETGYVFTTETGQPMDPRNVLRAVTTAAEKVGLEDVDVHAIRHGAVTAMLEAGIHIKAVSVLVGHSNVATTAKIYAHVSDDVSRSAMQALSNAMGAKTS